MSLNQCSQSANASVVQDSSSPLNVSPGNKDIRKGPDRQADLDTKAERTNASGGQASGGGNGAKSETSRS